MFFMFFLFFRKKKINKHVLRIFLIFVYLCYAKKMSRENEDRDYLCMNIMCGLILVEHGSCQLIIVLLFKVRDNKNE